MPVNFGPALTSYLQDGKPQTTQPSTQLNKTMIAYWTCVMVKCWLRIMQCTCKFQPQSALNNCVATGPKTKPMPTHVL